MTGKQFLVGFYGVLVLLVFLVPTHEQSPKPHPEAPVAFCQLEPTDGDMVALDRDGDPIIRLGDYIYSTEGPAVPCKWLKHREQHV